MNFCLVINLFATLLINVVNFIWYVRELSYMVNKKKYPEYICQERISFADITTPKSYCLINTFYFSLHHLECALFLWQWGGSVVN